MTPMIRSSFPWLLLAALAATLATGPAPVPSSPSRATGPWASWAGIATTARAAAHQADVPLSPSAQLTFGPAVQRAVYGLDANQTGAGQTIAIIGWGNPIADSDLAAWSAATGVTPLTAGTSAGQVQWISVLGGSQATLQGTQAEVAMDVEYAHAIAPAASLRVYLVPDRCDATACQGDWDSLEAAVSMALADGARIVAGSWGNPESVLAGPAISTFEAILQPATANRASFFFASGDTGSSTGVEYPAASPWAVAIGGVGLSSAQPTNATGVSGWSLSGGGCSSQFARPAWQPAVLAGCTNRAVPDLALDGDPNTGVPVYFSYGGTQGWLIGGGTSLATPMAAALYADACASWSCGWANPALAAASQRAGAYAPVLTGSNGAYQAGAGWNAVAGWGVPNWPQWYAALAGVAPDSQATVAAPSATPAPPVATATRIPPTATPTRGPRRHGPRLS